MVLPPALTLTLRDGVSELLLCPEIGGGIAGWRWGDREILRRAPESAIVEKNVRQMGTFPLVPYSNRIEQAQLQANGQVYTLRPNFMAEPHSIHGFGWQRPWQVVAHTRRTAHLSLQHMPDADWPFACRADLHIALQEDRLQQTLSLTNLDSRAMPAGLGFHPYFPIDAAVHLQTDWQGLWQMGVDQLPTQLVPAPESANYSQPRPVVGWKIDHCFTGWSRHARLDYATHQVQIEASEACPNVVCFVPGDGREFIAIEPVSHINNAHALAARGVANTGMRSLMPGASFEIEMQIRVRGKHTL